MAASLTSLRVSAQVSWTYETAVTGLSGTTANANSFQFAATTTNGTGAGTTADLIYAVQLTLAGAASTTVNLASAPVKDFFGSNIVMARIKFLFVWLTNITSAVSVAFGNAANPVINWISAATATVKINNNGVFVLGSPGATGYPVTSATADQLKVTNNDATNPATVNLAVVGSSA